MKIRKQPQCWAI